MIYHMLLEMIFPPLIKTFNPYGLRFNSRKKLNLSKPWITPAIKVSIDVKNNLNI